MLRKKEERGAARSQQEKYDQLQHKTTELLGGGEVRYVRSNHHGLTVQ